MRGAVLAAALVCGCSSGPTKIVGGGAILTGVAADQGFAAVLTSPQRLSDGAYTGQLQAVPVAGGAAVTLDPDSSGGLYGRGEARGFLGGVTGIDEGPPATPHVYGGLYVWLPGLPAPAKVGNDVRELYLSQDGTTCVFMDWDQQTVAAGNTGKLVVVSSTTCGTGSCRPIVLGTGLTLAETSWRLSDDGKWLLATERGVGAADPGKALLVSPQTGQVQVLSTGAAVRSAMMTPTGTTAAWVEGANQIVAVPTASPTMTQTLATTQPLIESAVMVDAGTFVARTRDAVGPTGLGMGAAALVRVSSGGATTIPTQKAPLELFVSQHVAGQTSKYLFYALNVRADNGEHDLWMLDMSAATAQPVQLAQAVQTPIGLSVVFSDDGTAIHYLDNYDPTTRLGDEYTATLASPTRNLVATGIHAAAFMPGSTRLLYVNAPDAATGAGVLTLLPGSGQTPLIEGVGLVDFVNSRTTPLRTYYTQLSGGADDGVWYMRQP